MNADENKKGLPYSVSLRYRYIEIYTISITPTELFVRKMMMMCSCIFHISLV